MTGHRHRNTTLSLVAAIGLFLGAGEASADRHCAPVEEFYWQARTILLQSGLGCEEALVESEDELREAIAQAGICGCVSLQDYLESQLFTDMGTATTGCQARKARILDLRLELPGLVQGCH